jgi:hypothetical protein
VDVGSSPLPIHVLQHVISAEALIAPASNENAKDDADNERQNHRVHDNSPSFRNPAWRGGQDFRARALGDERPSRSFFLRPNPQ